MALSGLTPVDCQADNITYENSYDRQVQFINSINAMEQIIVMRVVRSNAVNNLWNIDRGRPIIITA